MTPLPHSRRLAAFTLVEVLVSATLLVVMMGFLLTSLEQTRRTINSTTSKVAQFQAARVAFEAMTRNLSQATLNTYWDLDFNAGNNPIRYRRQSDLHFVIDAAAKLGFPNATPAQYPTEAVFFQAPLGFSTTANASGPPRKYGNLANLLSVVGYYVEWNEDTAVPAFLVNKPNILPKRFRYRLMEVMQPGEYNTVYNNSNYSGASPYSGPRDWILTSLGLKTLPTAFFPPGKATPLVNSAHVLAENVVAMMLIPKVSERNRSASDALNDLTTDYTYDSRPLLAYQSQARTAPGTDLNKALTSIQRQQLHQLPPIVQVTMVAIDEESAARLQSNSTLPPDWSSDLFKSCTTQKHFMDELGDPAKPATKSLTFRLQNSDHSLPTPRMTYRVFTTDVAMRASNWSRSSK